MNDQQINEAIARHCGWVECVPGRFAMQGMAISVPLELLPDYCDDLNAMHEAEETLTGVHWVDYVRLLGQATGDQKGRCHASARQRAEAFLRTVGKWEDER